jgi:predicted ATPase/DNA-binding CsgD family transcriptional regulator
MVVTMSALPGRPPASGVDEFVGRDRELDDLRPLLQRHRLVTLTGPAGVGKTRLAVELIPLVRRSYRGGLWWVELAPLPAGSVVTAAVATALGREEPGRDLADTVLKACVDGLVLLVLDNCEHVVDDCAKLAEQLLAGCPRLRILTTSREQLGVPGEVLVPVPPLEVGEPRNATDNDILRSDAVRLFVARAREVTPTVAWEGAATPVLAALCARLDGLPLAIELAARQAHVRPPQRLLDGLDERLATLTASVAAQPRHRSLQAAIEWSYGLSTGTERAVFRRLAVLPGGFTDTGAAALCADLGLASDGLWSVLTGLVGKSLLVMDTVVPGRFRMLESLRLFGREQLVRCGELEAAHARLLAWLTALTPPILVDGEGHCDRLAVLRREHHNLWYAVEVARDADDPRYLRLALDLADHLVANSELRRAQEILDGALARCRPGSVERIRTLSELGAVKVALGETAGGQRSLREAVALAHALDQPEMTARAVGLLAVAVGDEDPAEAARLSAEKVAIVRRMGDRRQNGLSLNNLAWHLMLAGQYDEAGAALDEALPWLDPERDRGVLAAARHTGGTLALLRGDVDRAGAQYGAGLIDTGVGGGHFAYDLAGIALVADRRDQPERALRLLGAAATASRGKVITERSWRRLLADAEERARDRLGAARAVATMAAGAALTAEEAYGYAVHDRWPGTPGNGAGPALTRREQQVAELVAQGLTDRQIAARLRLSPRTVASHLTHIRTKLDLPTRTQVTVWAARRSRG